MDVSCPQMWQYRFWHIAIWKYDEVWVPKRLKHIRCNPGRLPVMESTFKQIWGQINMINRDAERCQQWAMSWSAKTWKIGKDPLVGQELEPPIPSFWITQSSSIISLLWWVSAFQVTMGSSTTCPSHCFDPKYWPQLSVQRWHHVATAKFNQSWSVWFPGWEGWEGHQPLLPLGRCHAAPIASARDLEVAAWERLSFNFFNSSASQGQGSLSRAPWVPSLDILQQKDESWSHKPWISAQASTGLTWELLNGVRNHQCVGAFGGDVGRTKHASAFALSWASFCFLLLLLLPFAIRLFPTLVQDLYALRVVGSDVNQSAADVVQHFKNSHCHLWCQAGDPFHFPWVLKWHRGSPPLWPRSIPGSGVWIPRYRPRYPIDCQHT